MAKIYSEDFRKCVLDNIREGMTWSKAIKTFNVSRGSISNWVNLKKETGSLKRKPRTFYNTRKIDKNQLLETIKTSPDLTLKELAEIFNCSYQAVSVMCRKLNITRKKNHALCRKG